MWHRASVVGWFAFSAWAYAASVSAGEGKSKLVEKTICVPQIVMERRVVQVVECRPVYHECPVTVVNRIPETTWVDETTCVLNPERRTRVECYKICVPIIERRDITYCASEPVHCKTPCTRCVCKPMPVKVNRTVCVDEGCWKETPVCKSPCKPDCGQPCVKKEWIPKPVQKEVCVTVWKPKWIEEKYDKITTTMKCANRTSTVNVVTGYRSECKTREVTYTACVPTTVTKQVPVTTYKCIEIPYTRRTCVMVPHCVEKEIMVPVCRMVKKTILVDCDAAN